MRADKPSRLIVNLAFPLEGGFWGFKSSGEMESVLSELHDRSLGRLNYGKPERKWLAGRLLDFRPTEPGPTMVFIVHASDLDQCFDSKMKSLSVTRNGITIPGVEWKSTLGVSILAASTAEKINKRYCQSKFEQLHFLSFHRGGPPWFEMAFLSAIRTKDPEPLLAAVAAQLHVLQVKSSEEIPRVQALSILCQGYLAVHSGPTGMPTFPRSEDGYAEVVDAFALMGWPDFMRRHAEKLAPVPDSNQAAVCQSAWWRNGLSDDDILTGLRGEWGGVHANWDHVRILIETIQSGRLIGPAMVARAFLALAKRISTANSLG